MICAKPYIAPGLKAYGCGSCLACRINKRRVWTHRLMLEGLSHGDTAFWTLTYSDEELPADGGLSPSHLRDFLKRYRKAIAPTKLRFFACGEYGENTQRPHYHVVAFGVPGCDRGGSRFDSRSDRCCPSCDRLRDVWGRGMVHVGEFNEKTAQYVAGYAIKKLGDCDSDADILNGRHPEFIRMSNRPGLGSESLEKLAETIEHYGLEDNVDVPNALRHGGKLWPLGRYLRRQLRKRLGRDENTPTHVVEALQMELQEMREKAQEAPKGFRTFAFQQALVDASQGKLASLEWKRKESQRRKVLK